MRKDEINVHFSHDNPSLEAEQNILILWRMEWLGWWRNKPQTNSPLLIITASIFSIGPSPQAFPLQPWVLFETEKLGGNHVSSFYFLEEPPPNRQS